MVDLDLYEKQCPGCGDVFEAKRLNQVYCSSICKNRYHNHKQRDQRIEAKKRNAIVYETHKILWKNRQILKAYSGRQVSFEELEKKGFQANYITRFEQISKYQNKLFCYDTSFEFIDEKTVKISNP